MGPSNMCKTLLIIVIRRTITSKNRIITHWCVFFGGEISQLDYFFFSENEKKPENSMIFLDIFLAIFRN
jgi:hypothetical protein